VGFVGDWRLWWYFRWSSQNFIRELGLL
jgi:hypothetical protein